MTPHTEWSPSPFTLDIYATYRALVGRFELIRSTSRLAEEANNVEVTLRLTKYKHMGS